MGLARGLLLLSVCMTCVSGSRPCPGNCRVTKKGVRLLCNSATRACDRGCKDGYFGTMCNSPCDNNCQQTQCQQKDGTCKCSPEYTFKDGSCQTHSGVKCTYNKNCFNNICLTTSRDDCIVGCKPGWFGNFCEKPCSSHCLCEQESGNCSSCEKGWDGPECGLRCSQVCKDKSCPTNGACVDGCSTGSYGERCELNCSPHCVSGCDQLSGDCVQCEAGRYGSTCQSECSAECAGANKDCDRDGRCFRGCSKGYYGENCTFNCPQKCDSSRCDINGTCSNCVKGFYGTSCLRTCHRCADGICHQMTGECTKGCLRGYYGSFCNLSCEDCKDKDCDKIAEECIGIWLPYIIGGGVLLIAIVLAVFIACLLKRMRDIMKEGVDTISHHTSVQFVPSLGSQLLSIQTGNTEDTGRTRHDDTYNHLFDIKQPEATFCLADDDLETSSGYCAVLPLYRGHAGQSVDGSLISLCDMNENDWQNTTLPSGLEETIPEQIEIATTPTEVKETILEGIQIVTLLSGGEETILEEIQIVTLPPGGEEPIPEPIQIVSLPSDVEEPIPESTQILSLPSDVEEPIAEPIQIVSLPSDVEDPILGGIQIVSLPSGGEEPIPESIQDMALHPDKEGASGDVPMTDEADKTTGEALYGCPSPKMGIQETEGGDLPAVSVANDDLDIGKGENETLIQISDRGKRMIQNRASTKQYVEIRVLKQY